jgi:ABC-type multidrug transport system ATPase subunit
MPFLRFSPEEYLQYMGAIQGIEAGVLAQRINRLLAMCRLENSRRMPIRHFSKGMLHKVGIMQALLSEPKLLLMDEPFSGLDAESQEEVMELLLQLGKQGMGLLFVSHEPEHYGRVATRMIVLNQDGGWQDKLLTSSNTKSNRLLIRAAGLEEAAARELAQKSGAELIMAAREACFVTGESNSDALLQFILGQGGSVKAVYPEREALLKWPGWVHDNAGGVWPPEGEGEQT